MIKKYTAGISALLLLQACNFDMPDLPQSPSFDLEKHNGVWKTEGYGRILTIDDDGLALYDITAQGCLRNDMPSYELAAYLTHYNSLDDQTLQIAATKDTTIYQHKRLNSLPEACAQEYPATPTATFEYFTQTMVEHYAFFDTYQINWQQRVDAVQNQINDQMSDQQLYDVMVSMMEGIEDAHLYLTAEVDGHDKRYDPGKAKFLRPALDRAFEKQTEFQSGRKFRRNWFTQHQNTIRKVILDGKDHESADGRIIWGTLGDIGYINILGMGGFSDSRLPHNEMAEANKAMDHIMEQLQHSRSIIIDVTTNSGGDDEVGRVIASYFTEQRVKVYSKYAKGAESLTQDFYVNPADSNRFTGPVYLVTSDHTVSAAETFSMAMRALPNVVHMGETTRGALSDVLEKPLPNGWELELSNEAYFDANGQLWEGKGVPPQIHVPIFAGDDVFSSHKEALWEVIEHITAELTK